MILQSGFQVTVEKPKPKRLLRPITAGTNSTMNQSQFLAITCNSLEAREKSRVHGAIGFGFASHWLKNWCVFFEPITKRSNRSRVITFASHLKTALKSTSQMLSVTPKFGSKQVDNSQTSTIGCVRLTVFRNRNIWNISQKSFVFTEIHIKIVKHLLKCYFKHINNYFLSSLLLRNVPNIRF